MYILAPSLLAADFTILGEQIKETQECGAEYLHIDVMDGVFVPSISFGMPLISSIRGASRQFFDVHLMIVDPIRYIKEFAECGADGITFHLEAVENVDAVIDKIHEHHLKAGISIKPGTPVEAVYPYLSKVEMILIMSEEKEIREEVTENTEMAENKESVEETVETIDPCEVLKKENEELKAQVGELKNAYAKAYADTENMKKRLEKDFETRSRYQMASFAKELLPVLDNCERALAQATTDDAYRKGVEMIYSQLQNALIKEEITEIEALNQPFDGNWHQALMSEEKEGIESGIVIEVLQKGYKIKDRILRPAMVKVSA